MIEQLIYVVLVLTLLGFGLYMLDKHVPMAEPVRTLIRVIVVVAIILAGLQWLGFINLPLGKRG